MGGDLVHIGGLRMGLLRIFQAQLQRGVSVSAIADMCNQLSHELQLEVPEAAYRTLAYLSMYSRDTNYGIPTGLRIS